MSRFSSLWENACKEEAPNPLGAAGQLMAAIADLLDVEQVEYSQVGRVALFLCDLSPLGFKGMDLNVVMVTHPPMTEGESGSHVELLSQYKHAVESIGFCFQIVLSQDLPETTDHVPDWLESVLICGSDLERLFASRLPVAGFFDIIRRQVHLQRLCPFNVTHEARGSMFRGREDEVATLTKDLDTQFVISGARLIGKTSLLVRAYNVLRVRSGFRGRVFFFNCLTWGNYEDCVHRIAHEVNIKKEERIDLSARNILHLLRRSSNGGTKPLVLFFDELDRVVITDAATNWALFKVLAEAVTEKWIRVVFAGFRSMSLLTYDREAPCSVRTDQPFSPFLGALEPIQLGALTRKEALSLFCDPFRSMDISLSDEHVLRDHVWASTGGHPFLIQFYGERVFRRSASRKPQTVLPADVVEVDNSYDLHDFLTTQFLANTIHGGTPSRCERACALLFAHKHHGEPWSEGQFVRSCQEKGFSWDFGTIHESLRNLVNASVLMFMDGRYSFTFPRLENILRNSYSDLDQVLESLSKG